MRFGDRQGTCCRHGTDGFDFHPHMLHFLQKNDWFQQQNFRMVNRFRRVRDLPVYAVKSGNLYVKTNEVYIVCLFFCVFQKIGNCLLIKKIYTIINADEKNVFQGSFVGGNVHQRECGKCKGGFRTGSAERIVC
jgi:hypothetical protein